MRILIIDDCPVNRQMLSSFLEAYGDCEVVDNGGAGLDLFIKACKKSDPFRLVCLDISMPGMNGYDTLSAMRAFESERGIPEETKAKVIIITAFSDEECLLKTYDKCQGYIIKPIRLPKLAEKLAMLGLFPLGGEPSPQARLKSRRPPQYGKGDYYDSLPLIALRFGRLAFLVKNPALPDDIPPEEADPESLEFFKNVIAGQLVAKLEDPSLKLKFGESLRFNPEKLAVTALSSGRVVFDGKTLKLEETMKLSGLVRESIDFIGMIEIDGSVADGVSIKASRGIKVNGDAGACELRSEGDVEVSRFYGKEKGSVKCGGDFKAELLYNCSVESRGSVFIAKEALHSKIEAADSIKGGTFTGGSCMALNNVEFDRAGSPKDVTTFIRAGVNFYLVDRKATLDEKIKETDAQISHVRQMLGPYADNVGRAAVLPDDKRKRIYGYAAELQRLDHLRGELQKELDEVMSMPHAKADPVITINEILHRGVWLEIGEFKELVAEDVKGPFSVSEKLIRL